MDIFETLTKTLSETGQAVAEKAKLTKDIIKVKDQIRANKKQMRVLTYKIGQAYLDLHAEDCDEEFADLIRGVQEAKAAMNEKEDILAELVSQLKFGDFENFEDFEADLEDIFEDEEAEEVTKVAEAIEEVTETAEETVEEVTETAEETVEEVTEAVEETAEEVTETTEEKIEE